MSPDEILKFEENPNLEKIITVRHLDDAAKTQIWKHQIFGTLHH